MTDKLGAIAFGTVAGLPRLDGPRARKGREMTDDALRSVLEPIVRGQIRSFVNDHPEAALAVNWFKRREDKTETFVNSVSKRIMRDLLCAETRVRLIAALGASISARDAREVAVMASGRSEAGVELDCASLSASADTRPEGGDRETGLGL